MKKKRIPKRKFTDIRAMILKNLSKGKKTVNQTAQEAGINWKTVDNHIIWLLGKGFITEVFSSPYVKIYEINEKGKAHLKGGKKK